MWNSQLLELLLITALSIVRINSNNVPVLILSPKSSESKVESIVVGSVLSATNFLDSLNEFDPNSFSLILLDELSDENIRPHLQNSELDKLRDKFTVWYQPSVDSPYKALQQKLSFRETIIPKDIKIAVEQMIELGHNGHNVILTGKAPVSSDIHMRTRRDVSGGLQGNFTVYGPSCLAMFNEIYMIDSSTSSSSIGSTTTTISLPVDPSSITFTCNPNSTSILSLNFLDNKGFLGSAALSMSLSFNASNSGLYWTLVAGVVTNKNSSYGIQYMGLPYGMETPISFSFACTRTYFQLYDLTQPDIKPLVKVALYISYLQIQALNTSVNSSVYSFGKLNYCQGFFSNGIWMAISASLLLAFILAFGISFLSSINTMERFDDPKGKPLTIAIEK